MEHGPDLRKIAHLSRLYLTDAELDRFSAQINQILHYIQKLGEVETAKVEPMIYPHELERQQLREDEVRENAETVSRSVLECAPEEFHDNFKVPQVLGLAE